MSNFIFYTAIIKKINKARNFVNSRLPLRFRSPYIFQFLIIPILLFFSYSLAANYSIGYYHGDEHFQVIEFMSYKFGDLEADRLPWEFKEKLRPWLAPFLYFQIAKVARAVGVDSHFAQAYLFRFFTMLFGIAALIYVGYNSRYAMKKNRLYTSILWLIGFIFFMPMFIVRISSENLSAISFWTGASLLLLTVRRRKANGHYLLVGILFGLSFQFRYQIAFMLFGACLWALIIGRTRISSMTILMLGFLLISGLGILIDKWGYGEWTFTPYNYFYANLIQKIADQFGVLPWDGYFTLYFLEFYTIAGLFLLCAIVLFCFVFFKHFYAWCIIPFLLAHFYIGHKETRFLFPVFYTVIPILLLLYERLNCILSSQFKKIISILVVILILLNFLFLPYFIFVPPERNMSVIQFITTHFPNATSVYYNLNDPFKARGFIPLYFYTPENLKTKKTLNLYQTLQEEEKIIFVKYSIGTPENSAGLSKVCTLHFENPSLEKIPKQLRDKVNDFRNLIFYGTFQVFECTKK